MDFVIFSSIVWDDQGGAHRPTQLARALARQSHRVLFVEMGSRAKDIIEPNIQIVSLGSLGLNEAELGRTWFGFEEPDRTRLVQNFIAQLMQSERGQPGAAIWAISFPPFVRLWPVLEARGYRMVYDCLDDFSDAEAREHYFASPKAESFLIQNADLITTVTVALEEKIRLLNGRVPVACVPNGVDSGFGARPPVPVDLRRGQVTLGFWGPLQDFTVDVQTLLYVARERPQWSLNLIGAFDLPRSPTAEIQALRALPNVHLLGPRPHDTLPNYLAGFDVCLIPFPDNVFSRGRDPIKLYEYLSGYKPVVALHMSHLAGTPYVFLANSPAEFVKQIQAACSVQVDQSVIDQFLRANSWEARVEKLLSLVNGLAPRAPGQAAELPERFDDPNTLGARTQAYITHLEQTAAERLVFIRQLEQHARDTEVYVKKLERTHPLIWLKRVLRLGG